MGFLADRRAEVIAHTQEVEQRATARRTTARGRKPAEPTEHEHVRSPGRTLARPAWWPEEETYALGGGIARTPNWTDVDAELEDLSGLARATHGRRLAIRICPTCQEQRSTQDHCSCGSTEPALRMGAGHPQPVGRPKINRIGDEGWIPAWAKAHVRLHPVPSDSCGRCQAAAEAGAR